MDEQKTRWQRKAKAIYGDTQWEKSAIAAGTAMDNRLHTIAKDLFGQEAKSGSFDMQQYLAWFDWEKLKIRGLIHKAHL